MPNTSTNQPILTKPSIEQQRLEAFCSGAYPEIFHAIVHKQEIWKLDPFDVESIHEEARSTFQRLLLRASEDDLTSGRIFMLIGESGCGKTHLMRALRSDSR